MHACKKITVPPKSQWIESFKKAAFIIGTSLTIFVAARNTITWHMHQFWGASGDFWQRQYDQAYEFFGGTDYRVAFIGTLVVTNGFFWALNILLIIVDVTGRPQFLLRYKMQPDKNVSLPLNRLARGVGQVVFNQIFVTIPFMLGVYYAYLWRGCPFSGDLPTFQWVLLEIGVFIVIEEALFYYSHRMLHSPLFYKRIHKRHHEWTAPIGVVCVYAHPVEHILSNILPPAVGPLLMGSHLATTWMWFCLAIFSTTNAHCGYHFPFFPSPEAHDFHHLKFVNNFGVLGVLDRLHGTDNLFRASVAYKRHMMMLTVVPPRELFPDEEEGKKAVLMGPASAGACVASLTEGEPAACADAVK